MMLSASNSILIGASIVGICVLANLGYTVSRDLAIDEASRRQQEQQVKATSERYRRIQSKEAWKKALKFIDVDFKKWLENQAKLEKDTFIDIPWAWVKPFELSDVKWDSARRVTVHGFLGASPKRGNHDYFFSWTRKVELKGDGVDDWWQADDAVFGYADENKNMLTQGIISSGEPLALVR